jgi:2,4-dienoyl-CoA reductase (NADPH2)
MQTAASLGIDLPFQDYIGLLFEPFDLHGRRISNRLAVHPMEGFDGEADGSPAVLTFRRYRRFAAGGSGLIWFEATAVVPEGRSNPRQLMLHAGNLSRFKRLVAETRAAAEETFGAGHNPFLVLQLTHSGRFSAPAGKPEPLVAAPNQCLDKHFADVRILSDDELSTLQDVFVEAARLAYEAGFDAVDIKACHGYLLHDLLLPNSRENSRYGGETLAERSRFLREVMERIRERLPGIRLAARLNLYDGLPYPYAFGTAVDDPAQMDLSEPIELIRRLSDLGCSMINVTMGIPRYNPHVGRPFNRPLRGAPQPPEHPLQSIDRLLQGAAAVQKALPDLAVVGTGYSWLRQFFPNVGAATLAGERATFIGLGRSSIAYSEAPRDLMEKGRLDKSRACTACSRCTELMRHGRSTGCAVRDKEIYGAEYKKLKKELNN